MEAAEATTRAPALVTGVEEHRASLSERKNYRRSKKIDDKLAAGAAAISGPPRRKDFEQTEAGRLEWKAKFNEQEYSYS